MPAESEQQFEPRLLLLDQQTELQSGRRHGAAAAGSLVVHFLLGLLTVAVPWTSVSGPPGPDMLTRYRVVTPLVLPPTELTQKAANTVKPSTSVTLQGLLSQPQPERRMERPAMMQPAAPKRFQAPPAPVAPAPKPIIEAPKLDDGPRIPGELQARNLPGIGNPRLEPPPVPTAPAIQTEEKPRLAFERPGGMSGTLSQTGVAQGKIPLPQRSTVDDAAKQAARRGGGGLVVGDLGEGVGGLGAALNQPNAPTRNGSSLELLSDPMGVDMKPYLIRILSAVRRNWTAVIPESARLGRKGKVAIQFSIDRSGSVPKLVIAGASGTEALDRAAVAGISASNPFPPLPPEFPGQQIRLQFTFLYNMPR